MGYVCVISEWYQQCIRRASPPREGMEMALGMETCSGINQDSARLVLNMRDVENIRSESERFWGDVLVGNYVSVVVVVVVVDIQN
jgi:hypothetical protein